MADLLGNAPEWQERALCSQTDPEAFFPEKGGSTREAKRICSRCEVKTECLEYALGHDERFGIWGGLSERERRRLKRRRRLSGAGPGRWGPPGSGRQPAGGPDPSVVDASCVESAQASSSGSTPEQVRHLLDDHVMDQVGEVVAVHRPGTPAAAGRARSAAAPPAGPAGPGSSRASGTSPSSSTSVS